MDAEEPVNAVSIRRRIVAECQCSQGSLAASFWRGMKAALPAHCAPILEDVVKRSAGGGRSWRLVLAGLNALKTRARDYRRLPDTFLEPLLAVYGYADGAQMTAELTVVCDGIEEAWWEMQARRRWVVAGDIWGPCRYCWRFGRRIRGGFHACRWHAPAPGNTHYKQARKVRADRSRQRTRGFESLTAPFSRPLLALISVPGDAPCVACLSEFLGGEASEDGLAALPRITVPWGRVVRRLPRLRRWLRSRSIIIKHATPTQIIEALDPFPSNSRRGQQLRQLFLHDERFLAGLCAHAEAWLDAAAKRRSKRGGARRTPRTREA